MSINESIAKTNSVIWSRKPGEWAEGYPVGNGRIGGMVLGDPLHERVALNHDLLWRRFWTYQSHHTASVIPEMRRLCKEGKWDEAHELILDKLPREGGCVYLNPLVPAGDMGIYPFHGEDSVDGYERSLDMNTGVAEVTYKAGGIRYKREYFCSWREGVMVVRLSASEPGRVSGEVALSRLLDPDCTVRGSSRLGEAILEGEFEEGVKFAIVIRVIQRGGRLTGGRTEYKAPPGEMPAKDFKHGFVFREVENVYSTEPAGISTCFDRADEVLLFVAITVDEESGPEAAEWCRKRLDSIPVDFARLKAEHIEDHQSLYGRVSLDLDSASNDRPTGEIMESLIHMSLHQECGQSALNAGNEPISRLLVEQIFNMGRYLAVTSGRPVNSNYTSAMKSPITLQGIWNQDRLPAWDCDMHLDLNLEACYWSLELLNLGELLKPLADWAVSLIPQGRRHAEELFGCRGVSFSIVCDLKNLGNVDDMSFFFPSAAAWVAQIMWQRWEYGQDINCLKDVLYPFLEEIAQFYTDFLIEDEKGYLVPCPSMSPEMGIKGRKRYSPLSSPSTIDLELIREVFSHILEAAQVLGIEGRQVGSWKDTIKKVPLPALDKNGCLMEWMEDHEPIDPGHRHRSHLVGLCPGDRITVEDTPEYAEGARKALDKRHRFGMNRTQSLTQIMDAQMFARLYEPEKSLRQLEQMLTTFTLDNLLIPMNDWKGTGKGIPWFNEIKVYQIESTIVSAFAIAEMLFQDRRGLLRLLPALPSGWRRGSVKGLRGKGGFEVAIEWEDCRLIRAEIKSLLGRRCSVKLFGGVCISDVVITSGVEKVQAENKDNVLAFDTEAGRTYVLSIYMIVRKMRSD